MTRYTEYKLGLFDSLTNTIRTLIALEIEGKTLADAIKDLQEARRGVETMLFDDDQMLNDVAKCAVGE